MKFKNLFDPAIVGRADGVDVRSSPIQIELVVDGHDFVYKFSMDMHLERRVSVLIDGYVVAGNLPIHDEIESFYAACMTESFEHDIQKKKEANAKTEALYEALFDPVIGDPYGFKS